MDIDEYVSEKFAELKKMYPELSDEEVSAKVSEDVLEKIIEWQHEVGYFDYFMRVR
jgi:hypothetical protein